MFQLFHFGPQFQVFTEECVTRLPVTFHQRVANKKFTTQRRINLAVVDLTRSNNRQPVNGDFFRCHHRALRPFPVRFAVGTFNQMLSDRLHPFRVDTRSNAPPQAAGFYQFRHHYPFRRFFE